MTSITWETSLFSEGKRAKGNTVLCGGVTLSNWRQLHFVNAVNCFIEGHWKPQFKPQGVGGRSRNDSDTKKTMTKKKGGLRQWHRMLRARRVGKKRVTKLDIWQKADSAGRPEKGSSPLQKKRLHHSCCTPSVKRNHGAYVWRVAFTEKKLLKDERCAPC